MDKDASHVERSADIDAGYTTVPLSSSRDRTAAGRDTSSGESLATLPLSQSEEELFTGALTAGKVRSSGRASRVKDKGVERDSNANEDKGVERNSPVISATLTVGSRDERRKVEALSKQTSSASLAGKSFHWEII